MLGAVLVPCTVILEYFAYPERIAHFFFVRILVSSACLVVFALSYARPLQKYGTVLSKSAMFAVGGRIS